jgi:hypothetical protein
MFKIIDGFNGQYSVSDTGVVISHGNTASRKEKVMRQYSTGVTKHQKVDLVYQGVRSKCSVHRLVAEAFLARVTGCNVVNHLDNNPLNNDVSNLEWTTPLGNTRHYHLHYRCPRPLKESRPSQVFSYIVATL